MKKDTFLGGVASLHDASIGFAPAVFFGYATMFGVHAAEASLYLSGVPGETVVAVGSMFVGAAIGIGTDVVSDALGQGSKLPSR